MAAETPTPVIFRLDRDRPRSVVAVFPTIPATSDGSTMTCFAHFGQHSSCTMGYYRTTKVAKPEEYAALKRELEAQPYGYKLQVYQRLTPGLRDQFQESRSKVRIS